MHCGGQDLTQRHLRLIVFACRPGGAGSTLPLQVQMRCIRDIIDGMQHAHSRGLYNCDLKLENVLMRADGSLVVADWGIAERDNQPLTYFTCAPTLLLHPLSHCL